MSVGSYNTATDYLNGLSDAELLKVAKAKKDVEVSIPAWTMTFKPEEIRWLAAAIRKERKWYEKQGFTGQLLRMIY